MAAPRIPNLNSLRRGGLRGRGRGGAQSDPGGRKTKDEIVQDTDGDAAGSRISAVDAGYLSDAFAKLLNPNPVQRRLPLMNRGTYVRTSGLDRIVETFLASQPGRKQIVSLGAGSDTRYFRLKQKHENLNLVYHEIDFESNTKAKLERIKDATFSRLVRELCSIDVSSFSATERHLTSSDYHIHAQDLRNLPQSLSGIDVNLPTLLISECCLVYLSPDEAERVLEYFSKTLANVPLSIAIYEPIRPYDSFGKTMVQNLTTRGIQLQTMERFAELADQRQRLRDHGFEPRAEDVHFIWRNWIDQEEKDRVEGLEWMDELEEFVLLARHYCISWGWKGWADDYHWRMLAAS